MNAARDELIAKIAQAEKDYRSTQRQLSSGYDQPQAQRNVDAMKDLLDDLNQQLRGMN